MAIATLRQQERIIANEQRIIRNQAMLKRLLTNQVSIRRDLRAVVKNQTKILANQAKIIRRSKGR